MKKGESFGEKFPHLISEWSNKNELSPFDYRPKSDKIVWWNCHDCGSEYDVPVKYRSMSFGCPYCSGHRVNHTNCLWTTHPEIAKMLRYYQKGNELSAGSNRREEFVCPYCNTIEPKIIQDVVNQGFSCPRCSDGISYPEKFIFNLLLQLNVKVERQKVFTWSKNIITDNERLNGTKKYDYYLPNYNVIIEVHGEQHFYKKTRHFRKKFEEEKQNDSIKRRLAFENKITYYIELNCSETNILYIKNSVISSLMNKLFNLEYVNWDKCHYYAISSLVKEACELWSKFRDVKNIAKEMNLSETTIRKYLNQGNKIGLCDYDGQKIAKEVRKQNLGKFQKDKRVSVVQLEEDGTFIREWESATDARKKLNINNILAVCRGKQTTAGWFRWMYKEDYEKFLKEKGEVKFKTRQRIVQLTLNGEFVKEYMYIGEALNAFGKPSQYTSILKACCDDNSKTAYGFRWLYSEDYEKNKDNLPLYEGRSTVKKVVQLDEENNFLKEYESMTKASEGTGVRASGISSVCSKRNKTAGGYKWMYKEDYEKLVENN